MKKEAIKLSLILSLAFILFFTGEVNAANCGGDIVCNCGDTLTSSRTLNSSDILTNCPSDGSSGINIGADNVVLDCAGYKINQSTPDGGSAVNNQGYDNVTIKNCILENFFRTILFQGVLTNGTIYNNTLLSSSGYGMDIEQGPNYLNISKNTISNSEYVGIILHQSTFNTIENNTVTGSPRGIQITSNSGENSIVDNSFCRNTVWDIEFEYGAGNNNVGDNICNLLYPYGTNDVTCSRKCPFTQGVCSNIMTSNITLTQNISNCARNGIIIGANDITLDCNGYSINGTASYGILNDGMNDVTIKNCNVLDFGWGIYFDSANRGRVSYNNISRGSFGIGWYGSFEGVINNNQIFDGEGSGMLISDWSARNSIYDNIISKNELFGLNVDGYSSDNNITNNNFCFNAEREDQDVSISSTVFDNYGTNFFGQINDASEGNNSNFVKSGECIVPEFVQGQCNQVVDSNITLTEDIVNCTSNYVLRIFANDITIDCNGHTLSGVNRGTDGIRNGDYNRTTVKNCIFKDFSYGAYYYYYYYEDEDFIMENNTFENNTFENNDYGAYFYYFSGNNLSGNRFISNNIGLALEDESSNSSVFNNNFSSNSESALYVETSRNHNISFNNFDNNWYGVNLGGDADYNYILDNNFTGNYYGFYLNYADNNQIGRNYVDSSSYNFGDSGSSCPFLYSWNGTSYTFISDMSTEGKLSLSKLYPDDYLKIDGNQLQPQDGKYNLKVTEEYDEISFIDELKLITIDHSPDVDVFNGLTRADAHSIYTVSKTPSPVVSCVDALGNNCLSEVSAKDGVFTMHPVDNITNMVTLNLGNLSNASEIKLIISYAWANGYLVPNYKKSIQILDEKGNWVSILSDSDLTTRAALQKTYVLNLTNRFLTDDYSVRLVLPIQAIDYLAVDTTPEKEVSIHEYSPLSADLHYRGYSNFVTNITKTFFYNDLINQSFSVPSGNFTKYGDVLSLVNSTDDIYSIISHGDEISVSFEYDAIPDGQERDFLMFEYAYYKPASLEIGKQVEPLPFSGMSKYPYPGNESYPTDEEHQNYLAEYNTREIFSKRYAGALPYGFNNSVSNNTIIVSEGSFGLYLYEETNTSILSNNISGEGIGIELDSSIGTIVKGNKVVVDSNAFYAQASSNNEVKDNTFNTSSQITSVIFVNEQSDKNIILHNTIIGDIWVVDYNGDNEYNDSYSGNSYYMLDGSSSWYFYSDWDFHSIDDNGDGWADSGFVPFDAMHSQNGEWPQFGADYHPAVTENPSIRSLNVSLVSPENNMNFNSGSINFIFNPSIGWNGQELQYCNLTASKNRISEIDSLNETGLMASWHFNNNLNDYSGNGNNGVAEGTSFSSDNKFEGYSLNVSSEGEYVDFGNPSELQITENLSVSAWVKISSAGTGSLRAVASKLVFYGTGEELGYELGLWGDDTVYFSLGVNSNDYDNAISTESLSLNEWHLISGTYDGQTIKVYIDGIEAGTKAYANGIVDSGDSFYVGMRKDGSSWPFHDGLIDEVAVWNRYLSEDEIYELYYTSYRNSSNSISENINQSLFLNLSAGNYTWNVQCTDNVGIIGKSETRSLIIKGTATQEESTNQNQEMAYSSYSPKTYFTDGNLPNSGNNFNLRNKDKINFTVNLTNHTLTLNQFNSTTAIVIIQSSPITAYLEKGILYEFDLNNDSINDVKVRYDGKDIFNKAKIFIQEIKNNSNKLVTTSNKDITRNSNWKIILLVLVLIIIVLFLVWKKLESKIIDYMLIKKIKWSHRIQSRRFK